MSKLQVSQEATMVLEELHGLLITVGIDNASTLKLNRNEPNSGIMPVVLEVMAFWNDDRSKGHVGARRKVISVAHYYEQNGDLCADPLMEFLREEGNGQVVYYATRYKVDGSILAIDRDSILLNQDTGIPEKYSKKAAYQDKVFATQWMRNIAWQQDLKCKSKVKVA